MQRLTHHSQQYLRLLDQALLPFKQYYQPSLPVTRHRYNQSTKHRSASLLIAMLASYQQN